MGAHGLVGREVELSRLAHLVAGVRERGAAVIIRGDAGMGKSALLAAAAAMGERQAARVLSTTGVESESHIPFSGLHQLLRSRLGLADALPRRHRLALLSAFGMEDHDAGMEDRDAEPYLVAFAALELLAEVADRFPIVLIVDDAQWIDPASVDALAFITRRLEDERIVALMAVREGFDSPLRSVGLDEIVLGPLDETASSALLDAQVPNLDPAERTHILAHASGNPLALVELPRGTPTTRGELPDGAPITLTSRLERAFAGRVRTLPTDVRNLLLVAAANDGDDLDEALQATKVVSGSAPTPRAVDEAVAAGIVTVSPPSIRFRHPLVRSAVYQSTRMSERVRAHSALAAVLADQPERRAWHRAASVVAPAEEIATELEHAARQARRRGATPIAVSALTRAAHLSQTVTGRGRRLCMAAELAFDVGLHQRGVDLLAQAAPLELSPAERLRASWLHERYVDPAWSGVHKVRTFCELTERMAREWGVEGALDALLDVALRCWWSNPDAETIEAMVSTAEALGAPDDAPTLVSLLAYASPVERGATVIERIAAVRPDDLDPVDALHLGTAATAVGAFPLAAPLLDTAVVRLRSRAMMGLLLHSLVARVLTDYFLGRWDSARTAGEEIRRLAEETAQPIYGMSGRAVEALSAAAQGDREGLERLTREAAGFFTPLGANTLLAPLEVASGLLALGEGRHHDAFEHVRRVFDADDVVYHRYVRSWAVADYVEAAVAVDEHDAARAVIEEMQDILDRTSSPLLRASLALANLLVADDDGVEAAYQVGLRDVPPSWPFLRARFLLAHGSHLRRQRRAAESRASLRTARDTFDALGAEAWSVRARRELRAAGEVSQEREAGLRDLLTPQELEIVRFAAAGLSNREIGERMFLSHRTVASHLYRTFPKLGVTSRGQLHALLAASDDHALTTH